MHVCSGVCLDLAVQKTPDQNENVLLDLFEFASMQGHDLQSSVSKAALLLCSLGTFSCAFLVYWNLLDGRGLSFFFFFLSCSG